MTSFPAAARAGSVTGVPALWQDVLMRTTLELPDDLLKQAKTTAVERGVTLRDLIESALTHELAGTLPSKQRKRRVRLPIFGSRQPGSLHLTNADLARAEEEEDLRRHGVPG